MLDLRLLLMVLPISLGSATISSGAREMKIRGREELTMYHDRPILQYVPMTFLPSGQ